MQAVQDGQALVDLLRQLGLSPHPRKCDLVPRQHDASFLGATVDLRPIYNVQYVYDDY
jgi:hypothetical protein